MPEAIDNYNYDGGRVFSTGVRYLGANAPYHVTGYAPGYALAPVAEGNYAKLKVEESRRDGKTDFLSCDGNAEHMGWTGNPFTRKEHELKFPPSHRLHLVRGPAQRADAEQGGREQCGGYGGRIERIGNPDRFRTVRAAGDGGEG